MIWDDNISFDGFQKRIDDWYKDLKKILNELPDFHYVRTSSPSKLTIQAGHYFTICVNKILFGMSKFCSDAEPRKIVEEKENKND